MLRVLIAQYIAHFSERSLKPTIKPHQEDNRLVPSHVLHRFIPSGPLMSNSPPPSPTPVAQVWAHGNHHLLNYVEPMLMISISTTLENLNLTILNVSRV